jgi:hypothetical protein
VYAYVLSRIYENQDWQLLIMSAISAGVRALVMLLIDLSSRQLLG